MSALREFSDTRTANRPSDIDNWQVMFGRVFSANLRRLTLAEIALHLMEELGETSDALIRMYSYKATDFLAGEPDWHQFRLESQIADVFSQLFGLAEKINLLRNDAYVDGCQLLETQSPSYTPLHLSDIIWSRYGCSEHDSLCCPFCKNAICRCEIILVPATRPTAELLERFENPSRTV